MKAAVCCPGPSLPNRWPGDYGYAATWAVNRGMLAVPTADFLSAGDIVCFEDHPDTGQSLLENARPRMGILTTDDAKLQLARMEKWNHLPILGWLECPAIADHCAEKQINWSVQAALLHAASLGAEEIDLYGCDGIHAATQQKEDCTGYIGPSRTMERWKREERDLEHTFRFLSGRGVLVNRIMP